MASGAFEPPPTYAEVILVDQVSGKHVFNPIWLKWFLDLAGILSASGGGSGTILHNALTGLQGGTSNEYYHLTATQYGAIPTLAAGAYTPTLTNTTNLSASTAYLCQYLRVGATVVVSGRVDIDPVAAGSCVLGVSLPVGSNIGAASDLGGSAACPAVAGQSAAFLGDAVNDRATMQWVAVDTANQPMYFTFAYRVI
jgi:hypothetical protein